MQTILLTVALVFFFWPGLYCLQGIVFKADTKTLLRNMLEHDFWRRVSVNLM